MTPTPFWQMTRAQADWVAALREKLAADKYNSALRRELNLTLGPLTIGIAERVAYARMLEETRASNVRYWWRYHNQFLDRKFGNRRAA